MCTNKNKKPTGQERSKLDRAFRMLTYATDLDRNEINYLYQNIKDISNKLSLLERKYNIKNYRESRNLYRYPEEERANVIHLWYSLTRGSEDLDYLFIDEDLYVC